MRELVEKSYFNPVVIHEELPLRLVSTSLFVTQTASIQGTQ
jgi:hypothetical protein